MGRKQSVRAAAEQSTTPPDALTAEQSVARVVKADGNSMYICQMPNADKSTVYVQLQDKFRNAIWIRRGGYVLVDLTPNPEHKGKVQGEIVNIVREEREWRKQSYWPKEFTKTSAYDNDSEEEESTVGRMPPSDSEDED